MSDFSNPQPQPQPQPANTIPLTPILAIAAGGMAFVVCLAVMFALNRPGNASASSSADKQVLYFSASWCPACQHMDPVVADAARQGKSIRRIDIDEETAITERFGIEAFPTVVLLENGDERRRHVGYMDEGELAWFIGW